MRRNLMLFAAALLVVCCLLSSCGAKNDDVPATPAEGRPEETVAPAEEQDGASMLIQDADEALLTFLSAACAAHEGYKTLFTPEGGAEYLEGKCLGPEFDAAFSENGCAMVLQPFDFGMGQTQYHVCFTTDHGETWKVYERALNVIGAVNGVVTDGKDYWAYGFASICEDSFIVYLTDHMTEFPEKIYLRDYAKTVEPDTDANFFIRSVGFNAGTQLLQLEIEAKACDLNVPDYPALSNLLLELNRDLSLNRAEKQ